LLCENITYYSYDKDFKIPIIDALYYPYMNEQSRLKSFSTSLVVLTTVVLIFQPVSPLLITHVFGLGTPTISSQRDSTAFTNNTHFLTYQNPDFGIKMDYPTNWTKQEDYLGLHTIVAFEAIHQNPFDLSNLTLAEVDLRVHNAPQNESFAKLNISQLDTRGQTVISYHKNGTTLGGLPALKIINYFFGIATQKAMQVWTFIPSKNVLVEVIYIAQPSRYYLYLPVVEKMIDSVEITQ
jgi:hypothetical protein